MAREKVISLRMERQFLAKGAKEEEYIELYRDMQPGVNVYWNGFGQPPVLSFRAAFDDIEFNRKRQMKRKLIKGRFTVRDGTVRCLVSETADKADVDTRRDFAPD